MNVQRRWVLLLYFGILLVSCQDSKTPSAALQAVTITPSVTLASSNTPLPTATVTVTPTRTRKPTSTHVPTATPTLSPTPFFQPPQGVQAGMTITPAFLPRSTQSGWEMPTPIAAPASRRTYRLRNLSAADAVEMLRQVNDYSYLADIPSAGDFRASFAKAQMAVNLAARELLLRYPDFPEREQTRWLAAFSYSVLNAGGTHRFLSYDPLLSSAPLDEWLAAEIERMLNLGWLDPTDLSSGLEPLGFEASPAVFAMHDYHDYEYGQPLPLLPVDNLYGDGRPVYFWLIHSTGFDPDGLYVAIAQQPDGRFQVRPLHSIWQFPFGGGTTLNALDLTGDGQPEVIMYIFDGEGGYKSLRTVIYQWRDGRFVEILHGNLDSSDFLMFDRADEWGRGGWKFAPPAEDGAVDIQVDLGGIGKPPLYGLLHWNGKWMEIARRWAELPDEPLQDDWYNSAIGYAMEYGQAAEIIRLLQPDPGPSDLARFQLAMAFAQQSRVEEARSTLQNIIDKPASPLYPLIPQLAASFLEHYQGDADVYRGCQATLIQMYAALGAEFKQDPEASLESVTLKLWGLPTEQVQWCSLRPAFRLLVASLVPGPETNVPLVLRQAGVLIAYSSQLDLDGDGLQDWLLVIDSRGQYPAMEAWALIGAEDGFLVTPIFEYVHPWLAHDMPQADLATRLQTLLLPGNSQPIQILQVGGGLWAWRVHHKDQIAEVETLLYLYVNRFEVHPEKAEVWTFNNKSRYYQAWGVYAWQERGGFTHIDPIERLVFELNRPQEAIPAIRKELALLNQKPDHYLYTTLTARLTYLLGLSYELSGDKNSAVRTYLEVWRKFPDTAFALLARAKLEETINP